MCLFVFIEFIDQIYPGGSMDGTRKIRETEEKLAWPSESECTRKI